MPKRLNSIPVGWFVIASVAATLAALWPATRSLWDFWLAVHDYGHGPLTALVAGVWLVIAIRPVWRREAVPSISGTVLLGITLLAWLVANNANSLMLQQCLMPLAIWLAILGTSGIEVARRVAVPVSFLYFAVPIWDQLTPALRWLSIRATEHMVGWLGVPAVVREDIVSIPGGWFRIADGCSGKRYFVVTLAIAVLAAGLNRIRGKRALLFVAVSAALALLANWIRIVTIIYVGHVTDMKHHLVAVEHLTFGNVVFVILLALVVIVARLFGNDRSEAQGAARPRAAEPELVHLSPTGSGASRSILPFALLTVIIGISFLRHPAVAEPRGLGPLPISTSGWSGPLPPDSEWSPAYVMPNDEIRARYVSSKGAVDLYINLYVDQQQGRELVFYANTLFAPGNWTPVLMHRSGKIGGQLEASVARGPDGSEWFIARTYEVAGHVTPSEIGAQVAYGMFSILGPVPSGVIALAAPCAENCESARVLVESFWDDMSASVRLVVPDSKSSSGGK